MRELQKRYEYAAFIPDSPAGYIRQTDGIQLAAAEYQRLIKYSTIIVSTVPMFIIYPFIQKYFEKGVLIGAVKG